MADRGSWQRRVRLWQLAVALLAAAAGPVLAETPPAVSALPTDALSPDNEAEAPVAHAGRREGGSATGREDQGALAVIVSPLAPPAKRDRLSFVLSPYLWLPVVDGTVGGTEPGAISFVIDTGQLLESYEIGGLIHGEIRHPSGWGVSLDYMFARLSASNDTGVTLDTKVDAGILEAVAVRRVALGRHFLDAYAGIRHWHSDVVVDVTLGPVGVEIVTGDTWTDPIIGARYDHAVSDRWRAFVQGDIGGFGADSELTWHAVAGASYAIGTRTSLQIAYKHLSVSRQSPRIGGGPPVNLDLTVTGPLVGFAWRF